MLLQNNKNYVTADGYVVRIIKFDRYLHATLETSPGISLDAKTAKEAWSTKSNKIGWRYRDNGEIKGLTCEWNYKLRIVEEFNQEIPKLPEGYNWANGFPRLTIPEYGKLYLIWDGHKHQDRVILFTRELISNLSLSDENRRFEVVSNKPTIEEIKTTVYRVYGKDFTNKNEAQKHLASLELEEWADEIGLCRGGEWSQEMVLDSIKEYSILLEDILSRMNKE